MARRYAGTRLGLLVVAVLAAWAAPVHAQFQQAGVVVDASGVLRKQLVPDPTGELTRARLDAAQQALDPQLARPSRLRKVSLNRLEAALKKLIDADQSATDVMRHLAGLTRVKYVFYYPESHDIVLAGPAEGWFTDLTGRPRGLASGRPVLELQDLVVALRAFPSAGESVGVIGCSIDPTPEGLSRMQEFLQRIGAHATPDQTDSIVEGLRTSMGMQMVRVLGISPKTHFAQVLVEADYRMKLIGIGLERPPVRLASYVDKADPADVGRNALQRWYFTPDYHSVRVTQDGLGMELVGDGVQLVGEDEVVTAGGQRRQAARGNRASQLFVMNFTRKYPELAEKEPVYAQLRNVIDLAIAAAFIQQQDYYGQAEWNPAAFLSEASYPVENYETPVQVETVVTSVWKGNRLMTPVGGGVNVQPELAIDPSNTLSDEDGKLRAAHEQVQMRLAEGQWWWD